MGSIKERVMTRVPVAGLIMLGVAVVLGTWAVEKGEEHRTVGQTWVLDAAPRSLPLSGPARWVDAVAAVAQGHRVQLVIHDVRRRAPTGTPVMVFAGTLEAAPVDAADEPRRLGLYTYMASQPAEDDGGHRDVVLDITSRLPALATAAGESPLADTVTLISRRPPKPGSDPSVGGASLVID
ncbi:hypothetical protein FBZ89_101209 [Nitrospirillum amazonense]|uniref:Uncharacterized protein n=1 Tax=Nitrospirillum amazonense TaxID=28077 RepID=A0A560FSK0_9PROT|nr:hypothetical protein [Nitrospirillum amazonense]TWB24583.1 hypothetical protein FBZ89_101209 [Nitrospirillum amazonense]